MTIQLIKRGDRYAIRRKTGIFWWYESYDDTLLWPDDFSWNDYKETKDRYDQLLKWYKENRMVKLSNTEIVMETKI